MDKKIFLIIIFFFSSILFVGIIFEIKWLAIFSFFIILMIFYFSYKNRAESSIEIENIKIPATIIDKNGIVIHQNRAHAEYFGFKDEEIIGKIDPTLPTEIINSIIKKDEETIELWVKAKKKNNEAIDVEIISFFKKKKYIILKRPIGYKSPILDKFMEAEKLAVIGSIASGLAHQLNTPLGTILLTSQLIKEEIKDRELRKEIDTIESQIKFCQNIVKKLLTLSKPSEEEDSEFNINDVIREAAKLFEKTFQKNNIKFRLFANNEKDAIFYGKRNEIMQVFMNLFSNSIDAMPEGGEIKVNTFPTFFDNIIIKISDTGKGIEPPHRDRIFEPFFTTKPVSKGTGLGL